MVERPEAGFDEVRGLDGAAFETPHQRRQRRCGRAFAPQAFGCVTKVPGHFLGLHHDGATLCKGLFLAGHRLELAQFLMDVMKIVGVLLSLAEARFLILPSTLGLAQRQIAVAYLARLRLEAAKSIEKKPVGGGDRPRRDRRAGHGSRPVCGRCRAAFAHSPANR